jgi:serine/threonine-protein kinase
MLWLQAIDVAPLDRALRGDERAQLAAALTALHGAGGAHGRVDGAHIGLHAGRVVLRFPLDEDPFATVDRDWLALARL